VGLSFEKNHLQGERKVNNGPQRTCPLLLGRTGAGKTTLVEEVSRAKPIELLACDKFYGYAYFRASVCRPRDDYAAVRAHLVGYRHPMEPLLDREKFADLANSVARSILGRDSLPVAEGCSVGYITALLQDRKIRAGVKYWPIVGVRLSGNQNLRAMYSRKVEQLIEEGALDEIQAALANGWAESYVIKKSMLANPLMQYVTGHIPLKVAKELAIDNFLRIGEEEELKFLSLSGVTWIEHDPCNSRKAADSFLRLLTQMDFLP
jgi:tRNA A37 N6-isopentenylltransferase MiaA